MDIVKLLTSLFCWGILRTKPKFGLQNRITEHKVDILKNPNNVYECKIVLYYFLISKDNIDQVISVFLSNRSSYLSGSK